MCFIVFHSTVLFQTQMPQISLIHENERDECLGDLWVWAKTRYQRKLGSQTENVTLSFKVMVMYAEKST